MAAILPADPTTAAPQAQTDDPSLPSSDYSHSVHFWKMANDILAGTEAMRAAENVGIIGGPAIQYENVPTQRFSSLRGFEQQSPYLPKFPNEPWEEYDRRRRNAFMTAVYKDISQNLSSKPFSKTCELAPEAGEDLKKFATNIDGLGNNMHVFAKDIFKEAMDKAITWIHCEFTTVPPEANLEQERNMGARPYWVHINPEKLLAVYSKFLNGKEIIFHARIDEPAVELNGYEEVTVKRVRELNREPILDAGGKVVGFEPATWTVYEEDVTKDAATGKQISTWNIIDSGNISIGIIPLVPVILGNRAGTSWRVAPPLSDLAYMQVKLFQMESNLDAIKELTAFPMLSANGVNGKDETGAAIKVPVGARAVLFAPMAGDGRHGEWKFIEPAGASLTFLETSIEKHKTEMRDLGYQPLTSSNLTVITTANISIKAHSVVQAWALMLKDSLEQAWKITAMWLKQSVEPVVNVHTDFGVDMEAGTELVSLSTMEAAGVISKELNFNEAKRRGVLADDADFELDQEKVAAEQANQVMQPESHIDPVTGNPIVVTPKPGTLNPPPKPPIKVRPGERVVN